MIVALRRRNNPFSLISHAQQDANTQDWTSEVFWMGMGRGVLDISPSNGSEMAQSVTTPACDYRKDGCHVTQV
jgi:hypothetical protein